LHGSNWQQIKATLQRIGAPITAEDLGVKDTDVIKALQMAAGIRPERYTILHKLKLNYDACETVARATGIIS
jgi:glycerol-1-phosphate dehydrogenase [NAD(P)+]